MCGLFYLQNSPKLQQQLGIVSKEQLKDLQAGYWVGKSDLAEKTFYRPTDPILYLQQDPKGHFRLSQANHWWLLLNPDGTPNQRWAAFNAQIKKVLNPQGTMHAISPESYRVAIPTSGYVEYQAKNRPWQLSKADGSSMFMAGVAKNYVINQQIKTTVAMVTLPGHEKISHIHKKSVPLMLTEKDLELWINNETPTSNFHHFEKTILPFDLLLKQLNDTEGFTADMFAQQELVEKD